MSNTLLSTNNIKIMNAEEKRLQQHEWKKWGPYLSERQWGTVREDYSEHGNAWEYFRMIMHAQEYTVGVKMELQASVMICNGFALPLQYGMVRIPF